MFTAVNTEMIDKMATAMSTSMSVNPNDFFKDLKKKDTDKPEGE
jgi:hypothetical protein